MSKYQDRRIISATHGNRRESSSVEKYNAALDGLSGAGDNAKVDSDFNITQGIVNDLKLNNYNGGSSGSLRSTTDPPKRNESNANFFGTLKDVYYNAVLEKNNIKQKKILSMPDKIVGMLKVFQNANDQLKLALSQPSGAPGSINTGLMAQNVNMLKYLNEFNRNGDVNINIDLDENDEVVIHTDNAEPVYVEKLIEQQTNTNVNAESIVPTLGDPQTLIWEPMDSVGPVPLIEQLTMDLKLKSDKENPKYTLEDNLKIESQIVEYDHTNMLNNKQVGQSLWPQAQQMAVTAFNTIDMENIENATPLQQKLMYIFNEYNDHAYNNVNLIDDYINNGGEKWGVYVGADANYDQQNSKLVKFQRDILGWSFNNGYHSQNVLPHIKQEEAVKQGETTSEEKAKVYDLDETSIDNESGNILDDTIEKI